MFYYTNQLVKTGTVMNILTAVNETYLEPLSVMLYSLAVHHPLPLNRSEERRVGKECRL